MYILDLPDDTSRGDAAFAIPQLYTFLETEDYCYVIRLKSNAAAAIVGADVGPKNSNMVVGASGGAV